MKRNVTYLCCAFLLTGLTVLAGCTFVDALGDKESQPDAAVESPAEGESCCETCDCEDCPGEGCECGCEGKGKEEAVSPSDETAFIRDAGGVVSGEMTFVSDPVDRFNNSFTQLFEPLDDEPEKAPANDLPELEDEDDFAPSVGLNTPVGPLDMEELGLSDDEDEGPLSPVADDTGGRIDDQIQQLQRQLDDHAKQIRSLRVKTEELTSNSKIREQVEAALAGVKVKDNSVTVELDKPDFGNSDDVPVSVPGFEGTFLVPKGGNISAIGDVKVSGVTSVHPVINTGVRTVSVETPTVYTDSRFVVGRPVRSATRWASSLTSKPAITSYNVQTATSGPYTLVAPRSTELLQSVSASSCYINAQGQKVCTQVPVSVVNTENARRGILGGIFRR